MDSNAYDALENIFVNEYSVLWQNSCVLLYIFAGIIAMVKVKACRWIADISSFLPMTQFPDTYMGHLASNDFDW